MPNLFSQGSAANPTELITAIMDFAVNVAGFARPALADPENSYPFIAKHGMNYVFGAEAGDNEFGFYMSIGHVESDEWHPASGQYIPATESRMRLWGHPGPYVNHWLFTDIDKQVIHVVVEVFAGIFCHATFGQLIKRGFYLGGHYTTAMTTILSSNFGVLGGSSFDLFAGVSPSAGLSFLNYDIGHGGANDFIQFGSGSNAFSNVSATGTSRDILANTPQTLTGMGVGIPVEIMKPDRVNSALDVPMGEVPGLRVLNMGNTVLPGELVLNGEWQVFPKVHFGDSGDLAPPSGTFGYMYQRVVEK